VVLAGNLRPGLQLPNTQNMWNAAHRPVSFPRIPNIPRFILSLGLALVLTHTLPGLTGAFLGPEDFRVEEATARQDEIARCTIIRWGDWLDAAVHMRTHHRWHTAPACFDPDPEKRQLAALGNAQRHFARLWTYADVDTLIIALWPLVQRYNWTYRDLLNSIRPALRRQPSAPSGSEKSHSELKWSYPCEREHDLATYCRNVLGLRKSGKGVTAGDGRPTGYEVARVICPGIERGPGMGNSR
jgi:hypothetical protein